MIKKNILILGAAFCISALGLAQSPKEVKAYKSATSKMTVKAVNKFLKKYPTSVYADEMKGYRDSLNFFSIQSEEDVLPYMDFIAQSSSRRYREMAREKVAQMSISSVSAAEAVNIARLYLNENAYNFSQLTAAGVKYLNKEYVYAVFLDEAKPMNMYFLKLENTAGSWTKVDLWEEFLHRKDMDLKDVRLHPNTFEKVIQDKKYVGFSFECVGPRAEENLLRYREYCLSLMDMESSSVYSATFSGREILSDEKLVSSFGDELTQSSDASGRAVVIEGMSADRSSNTTYTVPAMQFLLGYMNTIPFLKPVSDADLLTDLAYDKWYDDNEFVNAKANVKMSVDFILLEPEASLIREFAKAEKESSSLYDVAILDFRGHTSLVARTKSKGQYILLWLEPQAKDKEVDLLLNSINFKYPDILSVYYYEGKKNFKRTLNLTDKSCD